MIGPRLRRYTCGGSRAVREQGSGAGHVRNRAKRGSAHTACRSDSVRGEADSRGCALHRKRHVRHPWHDGRPRAGDPKRSTASRQAHAGGSRVGRKRDARRRGFFRRGCSRAGGAGSWPGSVRLARAQPCLLAGLDPARVLDDPLRIRKPYHREADQAVLTDGRSIGDVAMEIAWRLGVTPPGAGTGC